MHVDVGNTAFVLQSWTHLSSLKKHNMWTLVPRKEAQNVLTNEWIFSVKNAIDDSATLSPVPKTRLVVSGF